MTAPRILPGLGLTGFWPAGTNGWGNANDVNLRLLSALVQPVATDIVAALPTRVTTDLIYILSTDNTINVYDDGAWIKITPHVGWSMFVVNKTANYRFGGSSWTADSMGRTSQSKVRMATFATTAPAVSEVLSLFVVDSAATIPANFSGSVLKVGTPPDSTFTLSVQRNGTQIGTVTVSTNGTADFECSQVTLASSDIISVVAPATADTTIANLAMTLIAYQ